MEAQKLSSKYQQVSDYAGVSIFEDQRITLFHEDINIDVWVVDVLPENTLLVRDDSGSEFLFSLHADMSDGRHIFYRNPDDVHPPIPVQDELLPVQPVTTLIEYQTSFRNDSVNLPEVALRYLIHLIFSEASQDELKRFAGQMRLELNEQRKDRFMEVSANYLNQ